MTQHTISLKHQALWLLVSLGVLLILLLNHDFSVFSIKTDCNEMIDNALFILGTQMIPSPPEISETEQSKFFLTLFYIE